MRLNFWREEGLLPLNGCRRRTDLAVPLVARAEAVVSDTLNITACFFTTPCWIECWELLQSRRTDQDPENENRIFGMSWSARTVFGV